MRLRSFALVSFVACAIAAACESFETTPGEPTPDAGEASSTTPDAAAAEDGSTMIPDAATTDATFCSTIPDASFCWSFDEKGLYPQKYGPRMLAAGPAAGAKEQLVTGLSFPSAWELSLPQDAGDAAPFVGGYHVLDPPRPAIDCELDLNITNPGRENVSAFGFKTANAGFAGLTLTRGAGDSVSAAIVHYVSDTAKGVTSAPTPVPVSSWFHARLLVVGADAGKSTAVTLSITNGDTRTIHSDGGMNPVAEMHVVLLGKPDSNIWVVRYDNVFCRYD